MAEFGSAATLSLEIPDSELRAARAEVEDALSDIEVSMDVSADTPSQQLARTDGGRGGGPGRGIRRLGDTLDDLDDLAIERNDLLEELIDETEEGNRRGRLPSFGGGGALGLLLAGSVGAAGLGLAGLKSALENFDPEFPDSIPLVGVPDEIPVDVDAPDGIPVVNIPDGIPLIPPGQPDPESPGDPSPGPDTPPSPDGPPSPGPGDSPGGAPDPVPTVPPDEIIDRLPDDVPTYGDGGSPSPVTAPVGDDRSVPDSAYTLDPDYQGMGERRGSGASVFDRLGQMNQDLAYDGQRQPGAWSREETLARVAGGAALGTTGAAAAGRFGAGALARGGIGVGVGGAFASGAAANEGNKSATRRNETKVTLNVDARDSRNTQETVKKVERKLSDLERRLREIENAGGGLVR